MLSVAGSAIAVLAAATAVKNIPFVIISAVHFFTILLKQIRYALRIIAKLARKYDCETMDAYTEMAKDPEMYKVDGLHPTPEGATKLAKLTYNWLSKPYKLPQK